MRIADGAGLVLSSKGDTCAPNISVINPPGITHAAHVLHISLTYIEILLISFDLIDAYSPDKP